MKRIIYIFVLLLVVSAMTLSLFSCNGIPFPGTEDDNISDTENKNNSDSANKDDNKTDGETEEEKEKNVCPACKKSTEEPHSKCSVCGEYVCTGDHSKCFGDELCFCGGGFEEIDGYRKYWQHNKCGCGKWICEHPLCEYCKEYIRCDSICKAKICNGGEDCNEKCNTYNCTCTEGCSDYEICERHQCEKSHMHNSCDRCGQIGIVCTALSYHNRQCPVCNLTDCQVNSDYPHKECEILMKQCPSCKADNMYYEHKCNRCEYGFVCDGLEHDKECTFCGAPMCIEELHKNCVPTCSGCGAPNESHGECDLCKGYLCVGNHGVCEVCGGQSCVGKHEICIICGNNLCQGDHKLCELGDDYRECNKCGGIVNKADYCHTCMACLKCCTCSVTCEGCGVRYGVNNLCQSCRRCQQCCVCLYYCTKCETNLSVNTRCDACGYCNTCCICNGGGGSDGMHPHSMTSFAPNCETYYGNEHFYCSVCDKIFVRILDADGRVFEDKECPYCIKGGSDNYCNHTKDGLHQVDYNACDSSRVHYTCYTCKLFFVYDEESITGYVECIVCNYGGKYCSGCSVAVREACQYCDLCFNCCSCVDRNDITLYCPKCKKDVSLTTEGMEPGCLNGGMYTTYTCYECEYTYRIENGTHIPCDPNFFLEPLGHKDSDDNYACDNCGKLYSDEYCVVCGGANAPYHECDEVYYMAVRAVTYLGLIVERKSDSTMIKMRVSVTDRSTGYITYSVKEKDMFDFVDVACVEFAVSTVDTNNFVLKYVPTKVTVYKKNAQDYMGNGYKESLDFDASKISYIMFTEIQPIVEGYEASYNDKKVAAVLNLPFEICDDCHGIKNVGDHGICGTDGCTKSLCNGHVHGECDHENATMTDSSYCGMSFHYYCPDCKKYFEGYDMGTTVVLNECNMCNNYKNDEEGYA